MTHAASWLARPLVDLAAWLLLSAAACGPQIVVPEDGPDEAPGSTDDAARAPQRELPVAAPDPVLAMFHSDGSLVLVRSADGAVLARRAVDDLGGARDLAVLPSSPGRGLRLAMYLEDEEGQSATLDTIEASVEPPTLSDVNRLGWIDGTARVAAAAGGLLLMAEWGPEWMLVPDEGRSVAAGLVCGRPSSLRIVDDPAHGAARIDALTAWPGAAAVVRATARDGRVSGCDGATIGAELSASARLVWLGPSSAAGPLVVDARAGRLALAVLEDGQLGPRTTLEVVAERVEHAVTVSSPGVPPFEHLVGVLLPHHVLVVRVRVIGSSVTIRDHAAMPLIGKVRVEDKYFSRDLAAAGSRLHVATSEGVFAIDVVVDDEGLHLEADGADGPAPNELRGPIVLMPSK